MTYVIEIEIGKRLLEFMIEERHVIRIETISVDKNAVVKEKGKE